MSSSVIVDFYSLEVIRVVCQDGVITVVRSKSIFTAELLCRNCCKTC